jgi:hypothetical protein
MDNVVRDYFEKSPCLRDIECEYGPSSRRGQQHWRSIKFQPKERNAQLNKECSRRAALHSDLDQAQAAGRLAERVHEINEMMMSHFNLADVTLVQNKHMVWVVKQLAQERVSRGRTFAQRSEQAARNAGARKRNREAQA